MDFAYIHLGVASMLEKETRVIQIWSLDHSPNVFPMDFMEGKNI